MSESFNENNELSVRNHAEAVMNSYLSDFVTQVEEKKIDPPVLSTAGLVYDYRLIIDKRRHPEIKKFEDYFECFKKEFLKILKAEEYAYIVWRSFPRFSQEHSFSTNEDLSNITCCFSVLREKQSIKHEETIMKKKLINKLKYFLGARSIRYAIVFCLLSILIWAIYCIPSFAMYPPDGVTHLVQTQGIVEYTFPKEMLIPGHSVECQYNILNLNPKNNTKNVTLKIYTDYFFTPINQVIYPNDGDWRYFQIDGGLSDLQDAVFHFIVSPGDNNPTPLFGIKCWVAT